MLTRQNNPLNEVDFYIILLLNITVFIPHHRTKGKKIIGIFFFFRFSFNLKIIVNQENRNNHYYITKVSFIFTIN